MPRTHGQVRQGKLDKAHVAGTAQFENWDRVESECIYVIVGPSRHSRSLGYSHCGVFIISNSPIYSAAELNYVDQAWD